jgi:hypothetical protein
VPAPRRRADRLTTLQQADLPVMSKETRDDGSLDGHGPFSALPEGG